MKPQTSRRRKPPRPSPPPDDVPAPRPLLVDACRQEAPAADDEDQRSTLEWLMGAFSSASLDEVKSACREAHGDAYRAAGILAARGAEKGSSGGGKRKKKAPAAAATGMVSGVTGKANGRTGAVEAGERRMDEGKEREAEAFVMGMMGNGCELDAEVIKDVLGHCGYDIEKAVDKLLDISTSTTPLFKNFDYYDNMSNMKGFMEFREGFAGDYDYTDDKLSDNMTESSSSTSENDHEHRYLAHCDWGEEACPFCISEEQLSVTQTNKQELQKKVLLSLFSTRDDSQKEPKLMDWKKVVKKMESFGHGLEFSVASADGMSSYKVKAKEDIYETFRGEAREHWNMMKSYYQRAAGAFSKGERDHASYLSEKGGQFRKLAREADEKASREIFQARNKNIQNEITIDLHGQHVEQAIKLLKLHLLIFTYTPSIQHLRVITGCGSHGVGKGKLKQSVIRLAEKEGIQWKEENAGTLLMKVDSSKVYSFVDSDDADLD